MSQLTQTAGAGRPIVDATPWRFAIFFLAIAAGIITLAAAFAAIQGTRADGQPAAVQPAVVEPGSRSDDYGLRHPVQQTSSDSRSDDYGLRHPVQQTSSDSRSDDYGLRHPVP